MKRKQVNSVVKNNESQALYYLNMKFSVILIKLQREEYELEKPVSCQVRSFDDNIKIKHHRGDSHMPVLSHNGTAFMN